MFFCIECVNQDDGVLFWDSFKKHNKFYYAFIAIWLLPSLGNAASPAQQADQIIQREQQRLEEQRQKLQGQELPSSSIKTPDLAPQVSPAEGAVCINVHTIKLDGASFLEAQPSLLDSILLPYEGQCLGVVEINNLLRAVTKVYFDRGFITTRVYVAEQDLTVGTLQLMVLEGTFEEVRFQINTDPQPKIGNELETALPGYEPGQLLNLRDLEQAVDQINRLPSNTAQMKLYPGSSPGHTKVIISNDVDRRFRFSLGLDNSGQQSTGRLQRKLGYQHDNLLGINDLLSINYQQDGHRDGDRRKSRSTGVYYEVPYGYWTFDINASYFEYASEIENFASTFQSDGRSLSQQLGIRKVVHRDSDSVTNINTSLSRKDTRNYLEDVRLESSSQKLTVLKVGANRTTRFYGGRLNGEFSYYRGLSILGGESDRHTPEGLPKAEFEKFGLLIQFQRFYTIMDRALFYSSNVSYQFSDDKLYGSEQVSIGGEYTVNGFRDGSFSGSKGGYLRQELSSNLLENMNLLTSPWITGLDLRLGLDAGTVESDQTSNDEQLYSGWVGLRTNGFLSFSVIYAQPFNVPSGIEHNNNEVFFSMNLQL